MRAFAEETNGVPAAWAGDQSAAALFLDISPDNPDDAERVDILLRSVNRIIRLGFSDSRDFIEFLESVVLHSLATVVKPLCITRWCIR